MARFCLLGYYMIKCHSGCVSTNQRPVRPSRKFDQPKNTDSVEDIEFLFPVKLR